MVFMLTLYQRGMRIAYIKPSKYTTLFFSWSLLLCDVYFSFSIVQWRFHNHDLIVRVKM